MSNYHASTEAALETACPLGPDKCGYYDEETGQCEPTAEGCQEEESA